ncbi:MAG TPA: alkaline phosphatase family protein [Vicinamibacterales bacterium]|nr:alkaline phosphatase family protein [Vicinamibacterales bacterium]
MRTQRLVGWLAVAAALGLLMAPGRALQPQPRRNVIIFVADALRHGSVTEQDTPALWSIRSEGVHFENSYSLFPTFTTANGSAIATGHQLGDTGDFSNVIWAGFATFDTGNFNLAPGTPVPFVENDRVLADLDDHLDGNYLGEDTLLSLARAAGYHTAAIGKLGPTAIQDIGLLAPANRGYTPFPAGLVIDDATGSAAGLPLPPALVSQLDLAGIPPEAPTRSNGYGPASQYNNGFYGDRTKAGTLAANVVQQQWFADVATRVLLPSFAATPDQPFVLLFWSRDPDGTQHYEGDSLNTLAPGVNGLSSKRSVQNADRNLQQILAWLDAHPAVKANTDVIVTSDHGVSTISRRELDRTGRPTTAESAKHDYVDASGRIDTLKGVLPYGFLAIDLATSMKLNLFDPDQHAEGSRAFRRVAIDPSVGTWEHPIAGNGLIGIDVLKIDGSDARAIVAANGGSDLIYVPDGNPATVQRIVASLVTYDYVSGVFVDDKYGALAGALPLSAINLAGATKLPRPAIVVAFKMFYLNPDDLQTGIQVSDTTFQEGQGMHGGFGRDNTFNNMAAIGPDFKARVVSAPPVSNADIVPTVAHILGLTLKPRGSLTGRVASEALKGEPAPAGPPFQYLRSTAANGKETLLIYQEHGGKRYLYAGCFVDPGTPNDPGACR